MLFLIHLFDYNLIVHIVYTNTLWVWNYNLLHMECKKYKNIFRLIKNIFEKKTWIFQVRKV